MRKLTLYIPGLFYFIPEYSAAELADLTALKNVLNLGVIREIKSLSYLERIAELFAMDSSKEVPFAAISRLKIDDARPQDNWLYADPVHFESTANGLVLHDSRQFGLSRHDALAIVSELYDVFKKHNMAIEISDNDHWYLKLANKPSIKTCDIHRVSGQEIASYLPHGDDESKWIEIFNDVQGLLEGCDINQQRQQRGEPSVDGLWFWGAGEIPRSLQRKWTAVYSDESLVECCGMLSSTDCYKLDEFWLNHDTTRKAENLVIVLDALQATQYNEPIGWLETIKRIETMWLEKIFTLLKQNEIDQLSVMTDQYEISLQASVWLRFWHYNKPLHSFFE